MKHALLVLGISGLLLSGVGCEASAAPFKAVAKVVPAVIPSSQPRFLEATCALGGQQLKLRINLANEQKFATSNSVMGGFSIDDLGTIDPSWSVLSETPFGQGTLITLEGNNADDSTYIAALAFDYNDLAQAGGNLTERIRLNITMYTDGLDGGISSVSSEKCTLKGSP